MERGRMEGKRKGPYVPIMSSDKFSRTTTRRISVVCKLGERA